MDCARDRQPEWLALLVVFEQCTPPRHLVLWVSRTPGVCSPIAPLCLRGLFRVSFCPEVSSDIVSSGIEKSQREAEHRICLLSVFEIFYPLIFF